MRELILKARRWVFDAKDGADGASEGVGPVLVQEPDVMMMLCHSAARAAAPGPVAARSWRRESTTGRAPAGAPPSTRTRAGKSRASAPRAASRAAGVSR